MLVQIIYSSTIESLFKSSAAKYGYIAHIAMSKCVYHYCIISAETRVFKNQMYNRNLWHNNTFKRSHTHMCDRDHRSTYMLQHT